MSANIHSLAHPHKKSTTFSDSYPLKAVINPVINTADSLPKVEASRPILGNIAQSSSHSDFEGEETYKRIAKRRFALHRTECQLLPDEKALASCSLHAAPYRNWIDGNHVAATKSAFFGGLKHCDNPNCVLCAPRRAEEQRRELVVMLAEAERQGLEVYHLTFTMSHSWRDSLAGEHEAMNAALVATFSGRWFDNFIKQFFYIGRVRAYEPPFGENGWHLHAHIVLLLKSAADLEQLQTVLFDHYLKMLQKQGRTADLEHGLKVEQGYSALASYVAKYGHDPVLSEPGLESEIADTRLKTGRTESLTPFELLAAAHGDSAALEKLNEVCHGRYSEPQLVQLASELFQEYFEAFKGKPRLVWSKGLRQKLDMDTAMDWYLSQRPEPEVTTLVHLDHDTGWKQIRGDGTAATDLRPDLLAALRTGDVSQVKSFIRRHKIEAVFPDEYYKPPQPITKQESEINFYEGGGWRLVSSVRYELRQ